jgi:hypothetical protein
VPQLAGKGGLAWSWLRTGLRGVVLTRPWVGVKCHVEKALRVLGVLWEIGADTRDCVIEVPQLAGKGGVSVER